MQLFIEQEFLNDFFIEFDKENLTLGKRILDTIFSKYTELKTYIDCNTNEEINILEKQNGFISKLKLYNTNLIPVGPLKEYLLNYLSPKQALVLLSKRYDWTEKLQDKGFLCFFYESYENQIQEIFDKMHFKIDLSDKLREEFKSWNDFQILSSLPYNTLIISDKYIFSDKDGQRIHQNLIPLLQNILANKEDIKLTVTIFSSENINNAEDIKKKLQLLKSKFEHYDITFSIVSLKKGLVYDIDLHDRLLYSNYSILQIGKGFNISSNIGNTNVITNSQIFCYTILEKYTYNMLKNHLSILSEYLTKLKKVEVHNDIIKFYPQDIYNVLLD